MSSLDSKIKSAKQIIQKSRFMNPVIAFSGGKDAVAVAVLAAECKVQQAVCDTSFYFNKQSADVTRFCDEIGLTCAFPIQIQRDDDWLRSHPELFFTDDSKIRGWGYAQRQQRTVDMHAREAGHRCIIFGRRRQENTVPGVLYCKKNDSIYRCNPLHDWTTDEVWQFVRQYARVPWIYTSPWGLITNFNGAFYQIKVSQTGSWSKCWDVVTSMQADLTPKRYGLLKTRRER